MNLVATVMNLMATARTLTATATNLVATARNRLGPLVAQVSMTPDSGGLPGGPLAQKLLNWAGQLALWGSLGSILVGAMVYGLSREAGNYGAASKGRTLAIGGVVGAILTGLAATIVNLLFGAAKGA